MNAFFPLRWQVTAGLLVAMAFSATVDLRFGADLSAAARLWLPLGVALGAWIALRERALGPVVIGLSMLAVVLAPAGAALGLVVVALLGPLAGAMLLRKVGFDPALPRLREGLSLLLLGGVVGMGLSAAALWLTLRWLGIPSTPAMIEASRWGVGAILGVGLVTPLCVRALQSDRPSASVAAWPSREAGRVAAAVLGCVAAIAASDLLSVGAMNLALFPPFICAIGLAATGSAGATFVFVLATTAISSVLVGQGVPVFGDGGSAQAGSAWTYFGILLMSALSMSIVSHVRRQLGEELRDNAFQFQAVAYASPAMIWTSNLATGHAWFNRAWERFVGRPLTGRIEIALLAHTHPDDRQLVSGPLTDALRSGEAFTIDCRLRRADGLYRRVAISGTPVRDRLQRVVDITGTAVDITDSSALSDSLRDIGRLLDTIPYNIWIKTESGEFVYRNKVQADFLGLGDDKRLNRLSRLGPGEVAPGVMAAGETAEAHRARVADTDRRALAGEVVRFQNRFHRDGQLLIHDVQKMAIRETFGHSVAIVGIAVDITEQEIARGNFEVVYRELKLALSMTGTEIWQWSDRDPTVHRLSQSQVEQDLVMSRWTFDEVLAGVHGDDRDAMRAFIHAAAGRIDNVQEIEVRLRREHAWRDHLLRARTEVGPDGERTTMSTLVDITSRKRAEVELAQSEARFRSLTALSSDWYWEQDEDLRFTRMVAEGVKRDLVLDEASILGKTRWELPTLGVSREQWQAHREALTARRPFFDFEFARLDNRGTIHWVSVSGEPMFDQSGRFTGYRGVGTDITARKQAEASLRMEEMRRKILFEQARDPIIIFGDDLIVEEANKRFSEVLRRPLHELVGTGPWEWNARYRTRADYIARWPSVHQLPEYFEATWLRADGKELPMEIARSIVEIDGRWLAFCVCRDISDRRQAEESLKRSFAELERSIELQRTGEQLASLGHWEFFFDGRPTVGSDVAYEIFGIPIGSDLSISDAINHYLPRYQSEVRARVAACINKGVPLDFEAEVQLSGSEEKSRWVHVRGYRVVDEKGDPVSVRGVVQDIDEYVKLTHRMAEMGADMRAFGKHAPGLVYVMERDNQGIARTIFVSESVTEVCGGSVEEWFNDPALVYKRLSPEDAQRVSMEVTRAHSRGEPFSIEYRYLHPVKGWRWMHTAASPAPLNESRTRWHGYTEDITQRKEDEAAREALQQRIMEIDRMESLGTLAGGIAHDFNNVLGVVMGHLDLLRRKQAVGPTGQSHLEAIQVAAAHARDIVGKILAYSQRHPLALKTCDVRDIVDAAITLLSINAPRDVRLVWERPEQPLYVSADSTELERVLLNMGLNSIHAIGGQEGVIRVTVSREAHEAVTEFSDRRVVIALSDTGCGMDENTLQRIFDPFFSTKPTGIGTGLGMSVAHGIIKAHQGRITVDSELGRGTTFRIVLREVRGDQIRATPTAFANTRDEALVRPAHVMYVDDQVWLVPLVTQMLESQGYRVTGFNDPRDAVQAFMLDPSGFDIVVTDYSMPEMPGTEMARTLREARPDIPVALISGYVSSEVVVRARAVGVHDIISKPNIVEELAATVQRMLSARDVTSPAAVVSVEAPSSAASPPSSGPTIH
jgi:PAS domain S-box-containing protein